jgi:hypothetical protein
MPLSGTFEYVAVVPDGAGTVFSCQARLQRPLGNDQERIPRLVGPSPLLQVEDAGPTPNPSARNPATERSRLRLTSSDRPQAYSFILDRGVISALHPGDLLHMVRTSCGGIGVSAIRSNELIFAAGAITHVPLGSGFEARMPMDLVREAEAVFQKRETRFRFAEYPVEIRVSGKQRIMYRERNELGPFQVWVLHGFYPGTPGTDECVSVARKGACSAVDANTSALFLDSGHLEIDRWAND